MRAPLLLASVLLFILAPTDAQAQWQRGCETPRPPAIGVVLGRSSPYFEPSLGVGGAGTSDSVLVRGGFQFAGRADLPIAGPWRARIEGASTNWPLERQIYSDDFRQVIATENLGDVEVRQILGLVGRQAGRSPVCAHVLAGGGLYSLNFQGARHLSPGGTLTAGLEVPAGPHGAVTMDVQLHLIDNSRRHYPMDSSTIVDTRFSVGWAYRF